MEFLSQHIKIDASQPNNTHVYAMKRHPGTGLFVPELQSTVYHRKLFNDQIDIGVGTLMNINVPGGQHFSEIATFYAITTRDACISRCAVDAVERTIALKTVRFHSVDQSCFCFETSFFEWRFDGYPSDQVDSLWVRDTGSVAQWFETEYCEFIRPDTHGRTVVWTKEASLPATSGYCIGSPVGNGYVIASGSVLESYHGGTSSAPFDVLCREKCEAHTDCQYMSVFAETWDYLNLAHAKP